MSASPSAGETPAVELTNRLGNETSPYLLQHKSNPVAWFPWGPEAFETARRLNRPIFLSVGYSTCYWCHVMERESFESEEIAKLMNELFVCVKVDREERPDVDDIYMAAVQITNQGQGGWPMSVFLEPDGLKPFLGGTYFPPEDGFGRPGFPTVLRQVADFWATRREDVKKQADMIADAVTQQLSARPTTAEVGPRDVERAVSLLLTSYDREDGGFVGSAARAPKFPVPSTVDLLIAAGWDVEPARNAVVHTLDRMAIGGMYDQIGGGFHRYSTDAEWLVPHFEKMLYDNGQLASTYAEAHALTGDPFYAEIVRETLDYVLREMTSDVGAFYSAQDAEVNHREGQNYLWQADEVRTVLADAGLGDDVELVLNAYGFDRGTNFQDPHHKEDPPTNVVFLVQRPDALAAELGVELDDFSRRLAAANEAMLAVRDTRDQPITDDKILTGWNGLMIAGFADAARVLGEDRYREAAERAADYILDNMRTPDGGLLRTSREGQARIDAFIEDYSLFIRGLLALYAANQESHYLQAARELTDLARERFWDDVGGGYFDTLADQADLFVRSKSSHDGAVPGGNSVMANNLITLYELTEDSSYLDDARAVIEALSEVLSTRPTGAALATVALDRLSKDHASAVAAAPSEPASSSRFDRAEPVTVRAGQPNVRIAAGATEQVDVKLMIGQGWHVNSSKPGIEYLIPIKIVLVGEDGFEIAVDYPEGHPFIGPEGNMDVYEGEVTIPVRITRSSAASGRPRLMITYQACNDRMCLAPETKRVPIAILGD